MAGTSRAMKARRPPRPRSAPTLQKADGSGYGDPTPVLHQLEDDGAQLDHRPGGRLQHPGCRSSRIGQHPGHRLRPT